MKVGDLIEKLSKLDPNHTIAIRVGTLNLSIGSSPSVTPEDVVGGFDWNSGTDFLTFGEKNLALLEREEYSNLIKFLQSSGTMSTHEVNKRYLERRDSKLKKDIEDALRQSCDGEIPTSSEDIYQCDWFQTGSAEFMDYVCKKFNIYNNGEDE